MSPPLTTDSRGYRKSFPDTPETPRGCPRYSEERGGEKGVRWPRGEEAAPGPSAAPGAAPPSGCFPPCPQEVLLKRAADLAEALYGVPGGNQVWRLRPPPRAGPGAARFPVPAAAPAVPALVFAGAPPEARSRRGRGSVQRPPRARAARAPGPQPPAPRRRGHQRLQQPAGHCRRGRHARAGAGCVPPPSPSQPPAQLGLPLPCRRAPLTAALPQATRAAAAVRPPAGSRPARARSRVATAAASELASAATGRRAWLASVCPRPPASSMAPRPHRPSPVSVPCLPGSGGVTRPRGAEWGSAQLHPSL